MKIMKLSLKILIYAVLALLILNQAVGADDKRDAEELIKSKLEAAIAVLQKKELDKQQKNKEIMEIVSPICDFELMAKLSLGKKHWPGLTEAQQKRFAEAFIKRLKETYLEKLNLYTDEKITYLETVEVKTKVQIPTELISKGSKIQILYKLYQSDHKWKIYDVEVEGVSIISTYRSQFDQALTTGTIDDLVYKLEHPETEPPKQAQTK
ncbi:MAG: ABC transporter substrate-binding protein [Pseudomonadota bacterium]|uniref:ABC transporter substrate-binding protein n=1 Tax=Candidatus Desulfatibia profunda TaxID=2841695 RepID=A0A8J6TIA8_9BACT|nr:ABC transporter substrate-binding protein [Candidatus Desulfatibia profunda]MBL7180346.1 ABC transporter substrate-binding protein [Desulfobacterales bacterium]MBU0699092.1 ABC transporter substrate-binding protein [Pseudomonadota bacterium]